MKRKRLIEKKKLKPQWLALPLCRCLYLVYLLISFITNQLSEAVVCIDVSVAKTSIDGLYFFFIWLPTADEIKCTKTFKKLRHAYNSFGFDCILKWVLPYILAALVAKEIKVAEELPEEVGKFMLIQ